MFRSESTAVQPIVTVNLWVTVTEPEFTVTTSVAVLSPAAGVPESVAVPFPLSWNVIPERCALGLDDDNVTPELDPAVVMV